MDGVEAVFILSPVVPDELNVTISALNLCREANIKAIAYLSVFRVEETEDVPHFPAKFSAERMIAKHNMPVTILRPNAYMQSPGVKDALDHGSRSRSGKRVFPLPISATSPKWPCSKSSADWPPRRRSARKSTR
jgi:uncharacterized protein YbjT (DUF2867 family)